MGLDVERVTHAFGGPSVVRAVSLAVRPAEVVCLLGPSGCGKTTLLRLAAGLETLQAGVIRVSGHVVADANGVHVPPEDRGVGLMFQDYALFPHLTVVENVAFGIADRPRERQNWVYLALERMGMAHLASSYPHTLSGGEQQRTALLRALAPEPEVLLLDEPFSDLDVTRRTQVREQTLALLRDTGVAVLMVTHDPEEAMFMSDRLLVMNEGSIVQAGTPAEIYRHPATAFVAGLFGPLNRFAGRVEDGRVATPLGPVPAAGFADGAPVEVLVRPEDVRVDTATGAAGATRGRIVSARLLGRWSRLGIAVDGLGEPLRALVGGIDVPGEGRDVALGLDPARAFVFVRP